MTAAYRFLPWVRRGLAAGITTPDAGTLPSRALLDVAVNVTGAAPVSGTVSVHGPGDVTGIDPRIVLRTDPRPGSSDVEPNYLALVEFDPPDFPWLFTPATASPTGHLRPWVVLVVIRERDGVTLGADAGAPLPVLNIGTPADAREDLPDLDDSWAWAHAQVVHDDAGALHVASDLVARPVANLSRLLCPRQLEPDTSYLACVVPAFDHGVQRGLGLTPSGSEIAPAWGAEATVRLPVYYHWRFATGADGDVESLAAALHAVVAPPELGSVTVQLATADAELAALDPEAPGSVVVVRGALVAPPNDPPEPTVAQDARVDAVLRARVDDARAEGSVGPPLYGEWHRDVHRVPPDGWLAEANAIAERRIAAGLGATVVRANQEALVQACWDQVGALRDANQLFNRALVSSHVASRLIARHLAGLPMGRAAQVTSSWQARVLPPDAGAERVTVAGTIEASSLPEALLSAGYRRVAASRRPAARRAARAGLTRQRSAVDFAAADLLGLEPAGPPPDALEDFTPMTAIPIGGAEGAVPLRGLGLPGSASAGQLRALQSAAGSARVAPVALNEAVAQGELEVIDELAPRGPGLDPDAGAALRLAEAWTATRDRLEAPAAPTAFVAAELSTLHGKVMAQADPATSIPRRTMGRLAVGDEDPDAPPFTGLRPIGDGNVPSTVVANPWVLTPVSGLLDRLPGSWLLPGMDGVPQDGVTVVETNPAFVAACLLGANQELEAELLWREFPTDRRGSPLRHFWARRDGAADIGPIHDWPGDASLGDLVSTTDGQLVLVVRGRLLLRYPDIVVYAIPGDPSGPSNDPSMAVLPDFFGRMDPDLTYAGFPMTKPQALADDVWFVLQQQPAAPRFGFDVFRDPNDPLETWSDVAWSDVGVAPGGHLDPEAQAVAGLDLPSGGIGTSVATSHRFGPTAAEIAAATLQRPIRVAIHASRLLPAD